MTAKRGDLGKIEGAFRIIGNVPKQETADWVFVKADETVSAASGVLRVDDGQTGPVFVYAPDDLRITGPLFYARLPSVQPFKAARGLVKARNRGTRYGAGLALGVAQLSAALAFWLWLGAGEGLVGLLVACAGVGLWLLTAILKTKPEVSLFEDPAKEQILNVSFSGLDHDKAAASLTCVPFRVA